MYDLYQRGHLIRRIVVLMVATLLFLVIPVASATQQAGPLPRTTTPNQEWPSFTFDYNDSRYQSASTITSSNIGTLTRVWNVPTTYSITGTPVVQNGAVYFADWGGNVYSVNVADGSVNWKYNVGFPVSSSLDLANGLVYVAGGPLGPTRVIALDQTKGTVVWNTLLSTADDAIWGSPIVYKDRLFIGVAVTDKNGENDAKFKGEIDALNATTGVQVWSFQTMIGNSGGASVWGSVVVDKSLNAIYFGTGNAFASGSNSLYAYSVISLSATKGTLNWYHQVYSSLTTGADLDFGSTPNLFTLKLSGNTYYAIGLGNKDGNYYILDRTNGNPIAQFSIGTSQQSGIIGLAGFVDSVPAGNPELFIPSANYQTCRGCRGVVEALYPSSSTVAWRAYSGGPIVGSVAIVPGAVLFGDVYGNLYGVSVADGSALFRTRIPIGINGGVTVAEGLVLVGNSNDATTTDSRLGLYAFSPSGGPPPPSTQLAVDGVGTNRCSSSTLSSCTVTLSTTQLNDVLMLFVYRPSGSQQYTISDSAHLTWKARSISGTPPAGFTVFYAISSGILTSDSIRATLSSTGSESLQMIAFGVSGANTGSPFDPGVPSECYNHGSIGAGGTLSCSIKTSNAHDMIIGFAEERSGLVSGSGFASIATVTGGGIGGAEYEIVTMAGTQTISFVNGATTTRTLLVSGDAIVGAP